MIPRAFGFLLLLLLCLPASSRGEKAAVIDPARAVFFSSDKIVRIDITVDEAGMEVLRGTPHPWFDRKPGLGKGPMSLTEKPYVKATVTEDGARTYKDVGVRLRGGMGSWRKLDEKPGLFLNMDKFAKGQRFHGMEKVVLHNSVQDPRFMNELLSGEVFRAAGVPAARVVHAVVTLNGRKLGLYYLKEGYDKGFLREHFGNADGHIYQGDTGQDINSWLELSSGEDKPGTPKDQSDLKALVAALNEPDIEARYSKAGALLDIDRFMRFTAAAVVLNTVDSYPLQTNNLRIYFDPAIRKFVFFPSGNDRVDFGGSPIVRPFPLVAQKLIETPQGREQYLAAVDRVLASAFQPEPLVKRVNSLIALLEPAVKEWEPKLAPNWQINFWIRDAIPKRAKEVAALLSQERTKK